MFGVDEVIHFKFDIQSTEITVHMIFFLNFGTALYF